MYTALVVDDQQLFREIVREMLEAVGSFTVTGEAVNGAEAIMAYETLKPDVVLMDVQMDTMNGFEASERIVEAYPNAAVVLISMSQDAEYAQMAKVAGAIGFFRKRDLDIEAVRALLDDHYGARRAKAA